MTTPRPAVTSPSAALFARGASLLLALALAACSRAPAEPDPPPPAASSAPAVAPLRWDVPGSWTTLEVPRSGPQKAAYKAPRAANDKEDAEVQVLFHGTGSQGDVEKRFGEWFKQFDGDAGAKAKREAFDVRGLRVEMVEVEGTYKISLTPDSAPQRKSPLEMVKRGHRLIGAAVTTPDRGTWFFKLTGPDETAQAARSALRSLLESAR
jgi:hypothetical protein